MRRIIPLILILLLGAAAWILFQQDDETGPDVGPELPTLGDEVSTQAVTADAAAPIRSASEVEEAFTNRPVKVGGGRHGLQGRVIDENGGPVPGAWVAAYSVPMPLLDFEVNVAEIFEKPLDFSLEPLASTFADDEGYFDLTGLYGRGLYLTARTKQRLTPRRQRIVPAALNSEEGVVLKTVAAADLRGRVIDENGNPVANAEVLVGPGIKYLLHSFRNRTFFMERVFTDAAGEYYVEAVPARTPLTANAYETTVHSGLVELRPLEANTTGRLDVRLDEMGSLTGTVELLGAEEAKPLGGATVVAVPIDIRRAVPFIRDTMAWTTVSNSRGEYEFRALPNGTFILLAQGREGRSGPVQTQVIGKDSTAPPIKVDFKTVIEGRLVNLEGKPVVGARVALQSIPVGTQESIENLGERAKRQRQIDQQNPLIQAVREVVPEFLPEATVAMTDTRGEFKIHAWSQARLRVSGDDFVTADFDLRRLNEGDDESDGSAVKKPLLVVYQAGGVEGVVIDSAARRPVEMYVIRGDKDEGLRQLKDMLPDDTIQPDEKLLVPSASWRTNLNAAQLVDSPKGRFTLTDIPPGKWDLRVQAVGYADKMAEDIEIKSGEVTRGVIVNLDRGATVHGRVVAFGTGEPLPGAVVQVGKGEMSGVLALFQGLGDDVAMTEADENGYFTVQGAQEGSDHVNVLADNFAAATVKIEPLGAFEEREDVLVECKVGGTIEGVVVDRHDNPLPGHMVGALSIQAKDVQQTATDSEGKFRMTNIRAGSYFMLATSLDDESLFTGDFASVLTSARVSTTYVADGEVSRVTIVDESAGGCRLTGVVTRRGEPLSGAMLTMAAGAGDGGGLMSGMLDFRMSTARTDVDGAFAFKSLAPGDYRMNVQSLDWSGQFDVVVADVQEDYITLEVPRNEVVGRVLAQQSGEPVKGASVQLVSEDQSAQGGGFAMMMGGGMRQKWEETDKDGNFRFEGLSPGRYRIEIRPRSFWSQRGRDNEESSGPGLGRIESESFTLANNEIKQLEPLMMPIAGSIKVLLLDSFGEPYDSWAQIRAIPSDEFDSEEDDEDKGVQGFGRRGEGTVRGLEPGSYTVRVSAQGISPVFYEGVIVRPDEVTEISVTLAKGVDLRLRVLDQDNQPLNAVEIDVLDADGKKVSQQSRFAAMQRIFNPSEDGSFSAGSYQPGSYTVRVVYGDETREIPVSLIEGSDNVYEVRF